MTFGPGATGDLGRRTTAWSLAKRNGAVGSQRAHRQHSVGPLGGSPWGHNTLARCGRWPWCLEHVRWAFRMSGGWAYGFCVLDGQGGVGPRSMPALRLMPTSIDCSFRGVCLAVNRRRDVDRAAGAASGFGRPSPGLQPPAHKTSRAFSDLSVPAPRHSAMARRKGGDRARAGLAESNARTSPALP